MHGITSVGVNQAVELVNHQAGVLVDVREPAEVDGGHIPNAMLPLSRFKERLTELEKFSDRPVKCCIAVPGSAPAAPRCCGAQARLRIGIQSGRRHSGPGRLKTCRSRNSHGGDGMYCTHVCGYCAAAAGCLKKGVSVETIYVDDRPEQRAAMIETTGRSSVPQIFIGARHVGGYRELASSQSATSWTPCCKTVIP